MTAAGEVALFLAVIAVAALVITSSESEDEKGAFTFTEYPYKETSKNEMAFHEYESACEQSPTCAHATGIARVRCVRECISPSCYNEIYQADQLEDGEIDVRLNSFKGCFIQRAGRARS